MHRVEPAGSRQPPGGPDHLALVEQLGEDRRARPEGAGVPVDRAPGDIARDGVSDPLAPFLVLETYYVELVPDRCESL